MENRARRAYLVAAPRAGSSATIGVLLDGLPQRPIHVVGDDLYQVAAGNGSARWRVLTLHVPQGARLYSFTFG